MQKKLKVIGHFIYFKKNFFLLLFQTVRRLFLHFRLIKS